MIKPLHVMVAVAALALAACANRPQSSASEPAAAKAAPQASPYGPTRVVKSSDGRVDGELVGTPAAGSKFAKLKIGMTLSEVTKLIGAADNMNRHETGKRWIPFYFGGDVQRVEMFYKGEGCLTYTGGNQFGGGGNDLIRITATPRADCLE